jgi:GNAT superfamily N-acetyltransferase
MSVLIRPPEPRDRPVWGNLWNGYLSFYQTSLDASVYDLTFARFFERGLFEPRCFLAWKDEHCVGLIHYFRHRHCWKPEDVFYIQDLFVTPETRGSGAGRALIENVYRVADAECAPTVYWMTESNNETAMQLYDRVAFRTSFIKYQR